MLSIEKCKAELEKTGKKFTDKQIKEIRDFLYRIGTIEYESFKAKSQKNSSHLHKGVN